MIENFVNGNFLIFNNGKLKLYSGSMQVENGFVTSFNKNDLPFDKVVNLDNKLITPVFCNIHLHLGEYFFKIKRKMSLLDYLNWTEKINSKLSEKNKEKIRIKSSEFTIHENIKYGNFIVNTLRGQEILKNYKTVKAFSAFPIMNSEKLKSYYETGLKGYASFYNYCCLNNIIPGIFLHSLYYNDIKNLEFAKMCYDKTNSFFAIHVAEDELCEQLTIKNFNKRSIAVLFENGLLNKNTLLVHGCELNSCELDLISKCSSTVIICPISNINLKQTPLNPNKLIKKNINWCVASDGLGSGETANLIKQCNILKKLYKNVSYIDLFKSITINPCKVLNCENLLLNINSKANFLVFDVPFHDNVDDYLKDLFENTERLCYNHINV